MKKRKKCNCWYGANPSIKQQQHGIMTTISVEFIDEGNKAAVFYFNHCPKCGRKL